MTIPPYSRHHPSRQQKVCHPFRIPPPSLVCISLGQRQRSIYQTLVVSVLLYASETWTLLAADVKTLEAFHIKCQRQILRIRWQDHVRNDEVAARTGLRPVMESIRRRREAIFGHVARMSPNIPAHQALRLYRSRHQLVDDLTTAIGSAALVVLATAGAKWGGGRTSPTQLAFSLTIPDTFYFV